ncbi:MAG: UPF0175 family protein [Armatimonadetes bacterium]|nr:UPF0175 family protein [Armatimonadota bacterium]
MTLTIEIPERIEQHLRQEHPDLERRITENYVVEAFRQGDLSSAEAGVILGLSSRWEAIDFLSERGVYPGYDVNDYQQDIEQLRKRREGQEA